MIGHKVDRRISTNTILIRNSCLSSHLSNIGRITVSTI